MTKAEQEIERVARQADPTVQDIVAAILGLAEETQAIEEAKFATKH